jgi:hypothetical protein
MPASGDSRVELLIINSRRSFASFFSSNARGSLKGYPNLLQWSKTRTAILSLRYAQADLTPESSACSRDVVQWEMDIILAYRHGLLYVSIQFKSINMLIISKGAFVGALVVGMYAFLSRLPHDATKHPQMATLPQDCTKRVLR